MSEALTNESNVVVAFVTRSVGGLVVVISKASEIYPDLYLSTLHIGPPTGEIMVLKLHPVLCSEELRC